MLRQTAVDPVDFAFITKKGTNLQVVILEMVHQLQFTLVLFLRI